MKKSIVFIVYKFPVLSETFIVSNIVEAIKQGYKVNVITNVKNKITSSSQVNLIEDFGIMELTSEIVSMPESRLKKTIKTVAYACHPILLFYFIKCSLLQSRVSIKYLFVLKFYYKYRKASILHVHFANASKQVSLLKKVGFIKSKLLVTFHGFDAHYQNETEKKQKIKEYKDLYEMWDKITTNSVYLKNQVIKLNCPEHKMAIVPMAIDLNFYKPKNSHKRIDKEKTIHLLSIGRLIEFKGHEYGIRLIKNLVDKGFNIKYTIIGDGSLYVYLNDLIKRLNLTKYIELRGRATQDEIYNALEASHIFLMTSIEDSQGRSETQGVVMAEAQAMGLPVFGFKSGGVPENVANIKNLVAEKNINELQDILIRLLKNPQVYLEMSKNAKVWAHKRYGVSTMVNNYYKDLL